MRTDQLTFSALRVLARSHWLTPPLDLVMAPFNPFDPRRHIDPYPLYERARRRGPIFHHRPAGAWVATGYEEAVQVLRGPVSVDRRHTIEAITPYRRMRPENLDLLLSSMIMRDAPHHGRLRTLVNRAFTPRAVTRMNPRIAKLTGELIDELRAESERSVPGTGGSGRAEPPVEVMTALADRLPIYVIGELLGIPREQRDSLKNMCDTVARFVEPFTVFDPAEMDEAIDGLRSLFDALATERTITPAADLLTGLVQAEADGQRLSRDELVSMAILLLVAGHETTSGLIGNAIVALGRNPEALDLLRRRPELAPEAVEEFLRYDSPIQATDRTVMEDFTVGRQTLPAGAVVLVLFGAANRDPRRYRRPGRLELDRVQPRPLSFGHGVHHCVGAALARMETAAVITAFVEAFPDFRIDEERLVWRRSMTVRRPQSLPVLLTPVRPSRRRPTPLSMRGSMGERSEPASG